MKKHIVSAVIALVLFSGCRKDPEWITPPPATGSISVQLQNMAGSKQLVLNTEWYKNENGDSVKFTKFNYFISNIRFVKEDGSEYVQPESYYLVEEDKIASQSFTINNIPYGKYKSIKFLIGVDSARNVSGAQTGALDQSSGMFWDWNTGYVMAKMEAQSPKAVLTGGDIIYHAAGFGGDINVLRTVSLPFQLTEVSKDKTPRLHLKADAMEWFKTPNLIRVDELSVLSGKSALKIADNYADMFSIDYID